MDQRRFDDLTRLLGAGATRRGGLRAALGGLLGVSAVATALGMDAEAKDKDRQQRRDRDRAGAAKRKHECGPDLSCPTGFACVKQGRRRRCTCSTGVVCDGACCSAGQVCRNGACTVPATCVAFGAPCKGIGVPCCDGLVCASGQGGENDVACYVRKTGPCASTAECTYGTTCEGGICVGIPQPPNGEVIEGLGTACDAARGDTCAAPNAVCTPYTDPAAPTGDHCTLPLSASCTGDPECTCYRCYFPNAAAAGTSRAAAASGLACCGWEGNACQGDRDCCLGMTCAGGSCAPCELEATWQFNVAMPSDEKPLGIAFLPDGRMLVSNGTEGTVRAVFIYEKNGAGTWEYTGDSFAVRPQGEGGDFGIAVGLDGAVYVAAQVKIGGVDRYRVEVWREVAGVWTNSESFGADLIGELFGVAVAPDGRVFVAELNEGVVSVWSRSGSGWTRDAVIAVPVSQGAGSPAVAGVAVAANGDLYMTQDAYAGSVEVDCLVTVFRETNGAWSQLAQGGSIGSGTCGSGSGQFDGPYGMAMVGPYLVVSNFDTSTVSVWSKGNAGWTERLVFGNSGSCDACLGYPLALLALGPDGLVYVADIGNARVSAWRLTCAEN